MSKPPVDPTQLRRWRMILGQQSQEAFAGMGSCELDADQQLMDEALGAIYDETDAPDDGSPASRSAGRGKSAPRLAKWLGDVRTYFSA